MPPKICCHCAPVVWSSGVCIPSCCSPAVSTVRAFWPTVAKLVGRAVGSGGPSRRDSGCRRSSDRFSRSLVLWRGGRRSLSVRRSSGQRRRKLTWAQLAGDRYLGQNCCHGELNEKAGLSGIPTQSANVDSNRQLIPKLIYGSGAKQTCAGNRRIRTKGQWPSGAVGSGATPPPPAPSSHFVESRTNVDWPRLTRGDKIVTVSPLARNSNGLPHTAATRRPLELETGNPRGMARKGSWPPVPEARSHP